MYGILKPQLEKDSIILFNETYDSVDYITITKEELMSSSYGVSYSTRGLCNTVHNTNYCDHLWMVLHNIVLCEDNIVLFTVTIYYYLDDYLQEEEFSIYF